MAKRSPLSEIVEGISAIASLTTAAERIVEQLASRALKPGPEDAEADAIRGPEPARSPRTAPRREKTPRSGSPTTRAKAAKVTMELADPASEGLRVVFTLRRGHVTATWTWEELVAILGDEGIAHFLDALDRADPRKSFADEPDEHEGDEHMRLRLRERP
jgi:hypothetical protein